MGYIIRQLKTNKKIFIQLDHNIYLYYSQSIQNEAFFLEYIDIKVKRLNSEIAHSEL